MRRTPTVAVLLASLAFLAGPRAALAQPGPSEEERARAAAAFDQGVARFRIGDQAAALAAFEEAYRLAPAAAVLYNIGKTRAALGRAASAYAALERYLSESGPEVPAARRAEVMRQLAELRPRIASVVLDVRPVGALLAVDGGPSDPLPPGGVLFLEPGEHSLALSAPGCEPQALPLHADAGGESSLAVTLVPEAPPEAPPPPEEPAPPPPPGPHPVPEPPARAPRPARGLPGGSLVVGTVGLVALGTTAVTGILALGADSDVDVARAAAARGEAVDRAALQDTASRGRTLATVADVALGVGVVALGVAIVWAVSSGTGGDEDAAVAFDGRRLIVAF